MENTHGLAKKVYQMDMEKYTDREPVVAHEIIKELESLAEEPVDNTSRDFKSIEPLVVKLAKSISPISQGEKGISKVNDTNYIIYFQITKEAEDYFNGL